MDEFELLPGDIVLEDSDKTGAKIVKFFMTAPTWYQHLWRKIRKTQENVKYYHVAMGYLDNQIIEQQSKVKINNWDSNTKQIIFRRTDIEDSFKYKLIRFAQADLDKEYDILNCFGKFLTWLTGIKWFARHVEWPGKEICINRVAKWYWDVLGERFNVVTHSELTTHMLYKYLLNNPSYKIVFNKE